MPLTEPLVLAGGEAVALVAGGVADAVWLGALVAVLSQALTPRTAASAAAAANPGNTLCFIARLPHCENGNGTTASFAVLLSRCSCLARSQACRSGKLTQVRCGAGTQGMLLRYRPLGL